jgi:flagellar basal-body rod protein FlgF
MFPQFYTGASGMIAAGKSLEATSHNLANLRTPAYRPNRPTFASYVSEALAQSVPDGQVSAPVGVTVTGGWRSRQGGPLRETGNPLDVALKGEGWLRVETDRGERFTRAGSLTRGDDGALVTSQGHRVLDDAGVPIFLPDGLAQIGNDGTLTVGDAVVARLGVANPDLADMSPEGGNLWVAFGEVGELPLEQVEMAQGYLEESGVEATAELVRMIEGQRMFEMQHRMVDLTANTVLPAAIKLGEP